MIPEYAPVVVSVVHARPGRWNTPLGSYIFRHIKRDLLHGYRLAQLGRGQQAFVAAPEKALLDLIYLQPGADDPAYLRELRLQNLGTMDREELHRLADLSASPKQARAATVVAELIAAEAEEYETL